jgi:hypothetical protein
MSSNRKQTQGKHDRLKWKNKNKINCGPLNLEEKPLCYPKSSVSLYPALDKLFQYRKNRNNEICNPTPSDPCLISKENLIKPIANIKTDYKVVDPIKVGNDKIIINCHDVFQFDQFPKEEQSYKKFTNPDNVGLYHLEIEYKSISNSTNVIIEENDENQLSTSTPVENEENISIDSEIDNESTVNNVVVNADTYVGFIDPIYDENSNEYKNLKKELNYYALVEAVSRLDCQVTATATSQCFSSDNYRLDITNAVTENTINYETYTSYALSYEDDDKKIVNGIFPIYVFNSNRSTDNPDLIDLEQSGVENPIELSDDRLLDTIIDNEESILNVKPLFENIWSSKQKDTWLYATSLLSQTVANASLSSLECKYYNDVQTAYCVKPIAVLYETHENLQTGKNEDVYLIISNSDITTTNNIENATLLTNYATDTNSFITYDELKSEGYLISYKDEQKNINESLIPTYYKVNKIEDNKLQKKDEGYYTVWTIQSINDTSSKLIKSSDKEFNYSSGNKIQIKYIDPSNLGSVNTDTTSKNVIQKSNVHTYKTFYLRMGIHQFNNDNIGEDTSYMLGPSETVESDINSILAGVNIDESNELIETYPSSNNLSYTIPTINYEEAKLEANKLSFTIASAAISCTYGNTFVKGVCKEGYQISEGVSSISTEAWTYSSPTSLYNAQNIARNITVAQLSACITFNGQVKAFCDYDTMLQAIVDDEVDKELYTTKDEAKTYPWICKYPVAENYWQDKANDYTGQPVYVYLNNFLYKYNVDYTNPTLEKSTDPDESKRYSPYYCEWGLKLDGDNLIYDDGYNIDGEIVGNIEGNCLAADDYSNSSSIIDKGTFNELQSNPNTSSLTLTKKAIDLAVTSLLCQYGNTEIPDIKCWNQALAYTDGTTGNIPKFIGETKVTVEFDVENKSSNSHVLNGFEVKSACKEYDGDKTKTPSSYCIEELKNNKGKTCAQESSGGVIEKNAYTSSTPYKANSLAMSIQLASRVCIPCDVVGGSGGSKTDVNLNTGSCASPCKDCKNFCVFTDKYYQTEQTE